MTSSIAFPPEVLEDSLLQLTPLQASDFDRLYAVASDPLIWEQHPTRDRYKREVFQLFFDGAIASGSAYLVFAKHRHELIGSTRFYDYKPSESKIAIGYTFLARPCWGGIYNKSMKKLMLNYAFQLVQEVLFHVGKCNLRSQNALKKIGAVRTGELLFDHYGNKLEHYEYSIKMQDWLKGQGI